ncbi:MAG: hypothetical protein WBH09_04825 [Rugosibacter sp.]
MKSSVSSFGLAQKVGAGKTVTICRHQCSPTLTIAYPLVLKFFD